LVEPISPELVLVDPELAEWARAQLVDPPEPEPRPRGASTRRLRPTPGRVTGGALLAVLALAAAVAGAAALWARHDHGSSRPGARARLAAQLEHDRSLDSSAGLYSARVAARLRPVAFKVPGAPTEPLDEIALPVRARRLDAWLGAGRGPTAANQRHWLYQHAWIVTGARFGWWHGAEALRLLIHVDRRIESRWGIGYRSEAVARRALASVEARTK